MFIDRSSSASTADVLAGFDDLVSLALTPGKPRRAFAIAGDLSHTYQSDGDGDFSGDETRFFWASRWTRLGADGLPVNDSTLASCLPQNRASLLARLGVAADATPSDAGDRPVPRLRVDGGLRPMEFFSGVGTSHIWLAETTDAIVAVHVLTDDLADGTIVTELSDPDILVHHWRERLQLALLADRMLRSTDDMEN